MRRALGLWLAYLLFFGLCALALIPSTEDAFDRTFECGSYER